MQIPDSAALDNFATEVREEYDRLLTRTRFELSEVQGIETVTMMILERFVFIYASLRQMERQFASVDIGRYNQLSQIWVKVTGQLLTDLKAVFAAGALNDVFVAKIMTIVSEELNDHPELLDRVRQRMTTASREEASS